MSDLHDLRLLLDSHVTLLVVESVEEPRVVELFRRLTGGGPRPLYTWSVSQGLCRNGRAVPNVLHPEPDAVLREIAARDFAAVYLLLDFHPYLDDPLNVRLLKEIAQATEVNQTVVLLSHAVTVPAELKALTARFELQLPGPNALEQIVREEARAWTAKHHAKVRTDPGTLQLLVRNLAGLTSADARRLARGAIQDDGAITLDDLPTVMQAKHRLLDDSAAITFEFDTAGFADVGGLSALKSWLDRRQTAFFEPEADEDPPKGILLVGVQGAGKSLAAKAVAGTWSLPLLRLDFGTLYNRFFGQTEQNLREALQTADLMSPCVLWVDEIEKSIAEGDTDQGTSRRLLGHLLTWMSERKSPVFLVATANNIDRLPPELIRKGRVDEIFFVDLPTADIRAEILTIHLAKRNLDPEDFDLGELVELTDGFSGAELEQAVVSARYIAKERKESLGTHHLAEEVSRTRPLSVVMSEKVARLRAWAEERTVPAD